MDPNCYDGKILPNGYQISLACGNLKKARYVNQAIEKELAEFKEEISDKFEKSDMNKSYVFPRRKVFNNASESPAGKRNQAKFHSKELVLASSSANYDLVGDEDDAEDYSEL